MAKKRIYKKAEPFSFKGAGGFDLMAGPEIKTHPSTMPKIFIPGQRLKLGMEHTPKHH